MLLQSNLYSLSEWIYIVCVVCAMVRKMWQKRKKEGLVEFTITNKTISADFILFMMNSHMRWERKTHRLGQYKRLRQGYL